MPGRCANLHSPHGGAPEKCWFWLPDAGPGILQALSTSGCCLSCRLRSRGLLPGTPLHARRRRNPTGNGIVEPRAGQGPIHLMESWQWIALFGLVVVAIVVLIIAAFLALGLFALALTGGGLILAMAVSQGFIGIVAFIAAWVFLFPIMLIWAIIAGWLSQPSHNIPNAKNRSNASYQNPPKDPNERNKWANRLPPYDGE